MRIAAKNLEFEKAALIRDRVYELRREMDPLNNYSGAKNGRR
jgi:protein-arginine kinase activator protein McsA